MMWPFRKTHAADKNTEERDRFIVRASPPEDVKHDGRHYFAIHRKWGYSPEELDKQADAGLILSNIQILQGGEYKVEYVFAKTEARKAREAENA